jgi:hypothetical protein
MGLMHMITDCFYTTLIIISLTTATTATTIDPTQPYPAHPFISTVPSYPLFPHSSSCPSPASSIPNLLIPLTKL